MNAFAYRLAERIRRNEPIPLPLSVVLHAATPAVRAGMWLRLRRPRVRVDARVISFGNITAGGTGKTPAVIERARAEMASGHRVAVLTRGYGTRQETNPLAFDPEHPVDDPYRLLGDEPALIARKVPGAIIVKCADRVAAARMAIETFNADTLILDDGFQHVSLERDENVAVIDATNPFGNGALIPRGILREPVHALRRATSILLTRCDQTADLQALRATLRDVCPDTPVRMTRHAPRNLLRLADGECLPLDAVRGRRIRAVCGIANPEGFFRTLESLGAELVERVTLPDHHEIPRAALTGTDMVIVTEKDASRLNDATENVCALAIELEPFD